MDRCGWWAKGKWESLNQTGFSSPGARQTDRRNRKVGWTICNEVNQSWAAID